MKQIVEFPYRPRTENDYRRMHPMTRAGVTKAERALVGKVVAAQLARPPAFVPGPAANRFAVTFWRIAFSPRRKDRHAGLDHGNLVGTFKAAQDEVAAWLGLDDANVRVTWDYQQEQAPQGTHRVRIAVEDLSPGEDRVHIVQGSVGPGPRRPPIPAPAPRPAPRARQEVLPLLRSYAVLPWDQDGSEDELLRELPSLRGALDPPLAIDLDHSGRRVRLWRRQDDSPELGLIWKYTTEQGDPS